MVLKDLLRELSRPIIDHPPATLLEATRTIKFQVSKPIDLNPAPTLISLLSIHAVEDDRKGCTKPEVDEREQALQDQLKRSRNVHRDHLKKLDKHGDFSYY